MWAVYFMPLIYFVNCKCAIVKIIPLHYALFLYQKTQIVNEQVSQYLLLHILKFDPAESGVLKPA